MKQCSILSIAVGAACLAASCFAVPSPARVSRSGKPNVIIFLVDDLGWSDLACYGSPFYDTPNIDALATQGVRFTDAYATCHVCSPSRASILTGRNPAHGHFRYYPLQITDLLDLTLKKSPERFLLMDVLHHVVPFPN